MKHKNIEKLIQKSLDREINVEEEKTLHSHLSQCHDCQQLYNEMAMAGQILGELIELFPQPGFNDRVLRKIGFKKARVWSKAAMVLAGTWLAGLVFMISSPLPGDLFNRILTSVPALMRLFDNVQLAVSSLSYFLMPLAKSTLNYSFLIGGLIFSIFLFYFFGKTITPIRKLGEDIKPYSRGRDF